MSSATKTDEAVGLTLRVTVEKFPLKEPFHVTGYTMVGTDVVTVTLEKDGHTGRGEASGVHYRKNDDVRGIVKQIEAVRARIEAGIDRESLQDLLSLGGARNAVDCALWDLEAKLTGRAAWQIAGLDRPRPLLATFTVGASDPDRMAPSFLVGQLCDIVDLDGPVFLRVDRPAAVRYDNGRISCPGAVWGAQHE